MTRKEFVPWFVIAGWNGWMGNNEIEGPFNLEYHVKEANKAADALYGPAKQVETDEMLALREAFVDACNWLDQLPTYAPSTNTLIGARNALNRYRDLYDECRRVLRGVDDDAS